MIVFTNGYLLRESLLGVASADVYSPYDPARGIAILRRSFNGCRMLLRTGPCNGRMQCASFRRKIILESCNDAAFEGIGVLALRQYFLAVSMCYNFLRQRKTGQRGRSRDGTRRRVRGDIDDDIDVSRSRW
jgi:hypothetical protein